ncbi:MAG TPA: glycosyltransferase [Chitinophagaceae bacterium]|nr:glycosyltransferase [Chitinophagaceae bacterium]
MTLSIIIVNYNVKHFLEQCLCSVQKAVTGLDAEVIVIDNNSSDHSIEFLEPVFRGVKFIVNKENLGFARACNQGLKIASGKYILFLNPDTIVPEDCFLKCIDFLEAHKGGGALGIKMLDGSGRFLKESKRAFPSPMTSLYKLLGLSKLFPQSKLFSKYHLGHLDENKNNEVDVLAGAFMMIKKEVLDKVGGFDEVFFMYGEDVDLSYRVQKAGYKNYYFAGSSIIHFKGESTRKGSMNYVRLFYTAMSIFVRKHYSSGRAGVFNFLIHIAIWLRAALSATGQFIRRVGLPLIDAGLILICFWLIKNVWLVWVRPETEYDQRLLWIAFPAYTVFFLITAYYAGLYDRWYKRTELISSMLLATVFLLAAYALLPERIRFSRGVLLFGSLLAFFVISFFRWILIRINVLSGSNGKEENANTLIVASPEEYIRASQLMKEAGLQEKVLGRIAVDENDNAAIGYWKNLNQVNDVVPFKEIVFCEGRLPFSQIIVAIHNMPEGIRAKFHASGSRSIVGSDSKNRSGEFVSIENSFNLANPYNKRLKRLIDLFISLFGIATFPVQLLLVKKPFRFLTNCFSVLFAQKTWISYATPEKKLPHLRPGIIACNGIVTTAMQQLPLENLQMFDYWYARDWEVSTDIKLLWKMYRKLGGS